MDLAAELVGQMVPSRCLKRKSGQKVVMLSRAWVSRTCQSSMFLPRCVMTTTVPTFRFFWAFFECTFSIRYLHTLYPTLFAAFTWAMFSITAFRLDFSVRYPLGTIRPTSYPYLDCTDNLIFPLVFACQDHLQIGIFIFNCEYIFI